MELEHALVFFSFFLTSVSFILFIISIRQSTCLIIIFFWENITSTDVMSCVNDDYNIYAL